MSGWIFETNILDKFFVKQCSCFNGKC